MNVLVICGLVIGGLYVLWLAAMGYGWLRMEMRAPDTAPLQSPLPLVTIVIAMRNEAQNIEDCLSSLLRQQYPKDLYEVMIVDDHSEDGSATVVQHFITEHKEQASGWQLLHLSGAAGKKAALTEGIRQGRGTIILTTDADCTMGPRWIDSTVASFTPETTVMVMGRVHLTGDHWFQRWQSMEMSALMGITGGSAGWHAPVMANGANLAFRKAAFEQVEGYRGNLAMASGDDVFLLFKMKQTYPGKVRFNPDPEAVVCTPAEKKPTAFLHQRIRWASKIRAYSDTHILLGAALVYFVHLFILLYVVLALFNPEYLWWFLVLGMIKVVIDFLFLYLVSPRTGRQRLFFFLLPGEMLNLIYIPLSGLLGLRGTYRWKGRKIAGNS